LIRKLLVITPIGAAACLIAGWTLFGSAATTNRDRARSPRSGPPEWGIYQIYGSRDYGERLAAAAAPLASRPQYVMFYRDLTRPFPDLPIDTIHEMGATPIVSLELWIWHLRRDRTYLDQILAGRFDRLLKKWAADAKEDGRRVLLRFGFEMNGDWFSWSQEPAKFVAAWRRAHGLFEEVGATNVEWVWAPNHVSCPDVPGNVLYDYYPGDDFVDWVGVDGYNWGSDHDEWHTWQTFDEIFGDVLDELQRRYPKKPVMIAEFGSVTDGSGKRAEWIRDAFRQIERRPQVRAAVWFNFDKRREGEHNWRIDATPESLAAFNATFAAPRAPGSGSPREAAGKAGSAD